MPVCRGLAASGGQKPSPTYEAVSSGFSGHAEAMEVLYDPAKVTYAELLDVFWHQVHTRKQRRESMMGIPQWDMAVASTPPIIISPNCCFHRNSPVANH